MNGGFSTELPVRWRASLLESLIYRFAYKKICDSSDILRVVRTQRTTSSSTSAVEHVTVSVVMSICPFVCDTGRTHLECCHEGVHGGQAERGVLCVLMEYHAVFKYWSQSSVNFCCVFIIDKAEAVWLGSEIAYDVAHVSGNWMHSRQRRRRNWFNSVSSQCMSHCHAFDSGT
jgi:hypothetical protein